MANKRKFRAVCHLQELMDKKTQELGLEHHRFGFSQQKLSEETGLSPTTIGSLLRRKSVDYFSAETTGVLLNYFNCEFSDLYTIELEEES